MVILFLNKQLQATACNLGTLVEVYGKPKGRKISQRLGELHACPTLADFQSLPATKCRQIDVHQDRILVCTIYPAHILLQLPENSLPLDKQGNIDWYQTTVVEVISLDEVNYA